MTQAAPVGTIGYALKTERTRRGISQRIAADELSELHAEDIPQPTYGRWETGEVEPGGEYLTAIFSWLGVDIDSLEAGQMVVRTKMAKAGVISSEAAAWLKRHPTDDEGE